MDTYQFMNLKIGAKVRFSRTSDARLAGQEGIYFYRPYSQQVLMRTGDHPAYSERLPKDIANEGYGEYLFSFAILSSNMHLFDEVEVHDISLLKEGTPLTLIGDNDVSFTGILHYRLSEPILLLENALGDAIKINQQVKYRYGCNIKSGYPYMISLKDIEEKRLKLKLGD